MSTVLCRLLLAGRLGRATLELTTPSSQRQQHCRRLQRAQQQLDATVEQTADLLHAGFPGSTTSSPLSCAGRWLRLARADLRSGASVGRLQLVLGRIPIVGGSSLRGLIVQSYRL